MTTIHPSKASIEWLRMKKPETDGSRLFIIEISSLEPDNNGARNGTWRYLPGGFPVFFAGDTACYQATHCGQRITFTTANLAAYEATCRGAYRRTGYLMTVFGFILNLHVMTNLVSLRMRHPSTGHRQYSNKYQACRHVFVQTRVCS